MNYLGCKLIFNFIRIIKGFISQASIIIFLVFLFFIGSNGCLTWGTPSKPPVAKKHESLRVHFRWYHQFQFAGYYAAVHKGYYREAGLTVTLVEHTLTNDIVDTILESPGKYGVSVSDILLYRLQGKPLVVLAAIFQHSAMTFVTRRETGITTPQDLIGKRVMMGNKYRNPELWATLYNEGVSPQLLHIINFDTIPSNYEDKNIHALAAYITDQPYHLLRKGISVQFIKPATYGIDFYGDCLFTSEQEINDHPERVKAFREASLKGWEYAMKHPEEIIDVILEKYGTTLTRDHLRYEAEAMRRLILPDLIEIGHMNPGRWKHIADIYVKLKMTAPNYSLEGFIYNPNPVKDYTWVKWTIGIITFIALMGALGIIILFLFNRRMQKEVNARKQTEVKLKAATEHAMAATRAKSEFLAKMSHEIRTPMNGVIGMTSLLANTTLNAEQKEYVEAIQISGNNLLKIINNILDFTKIEAGIVEIEEKIFELKTCFEEVFRIFSQKAGEKNIRLRYCIEPGVPEFFKSDVTLIKQVLINLVNNAIKAMAEGEILASVTSVLTKNTLVTLQFSVKDEGIGIAGKKIGTLFEAFSQVNLSPSHKYEGTGLGLSICKQLVNLLGGKIWVESTPTVGSTFFFTIKAFVSNSAAYQEQKSQKNKNTAGEVDKKESLPRVFNKLAEADANQAPTHILVAEDNKINQKLILKLLTKMGFCVEMVGSGFEVLEVLERKYYPLILMDIQMPGMDGVEATRKITERYPPDKRPKIVAMTANAVKGDREKYLEIGMDDYISKPFDFPEFEKIIKKWS